MLRTNHSAQAALAVTPSDTDKIAFPSGTHYSAYIYVGGTGDLTVTMSDGNDALFKAVPVGLYPIAVTKVKSTSTTATNILALY